MTIDLNVLARAENRDALLLAEVAALLHDVGKFTDLHMEHHASNGSQKWSNDDAYKVVLDNPGSVIQLRKAAANIKKPDIVNNVLNATSPKAANFLHSGLKTSLATLRVNLLNQDYSLAELIMLGVPGFATHPQRPQLLDGKDGWMPALLGLCHNVAHVDKEDPVGGEQALPSVLTSNAFGYERQTFVVGDPKEGLNARLALLAINNIADLADTRKKILEAFEYGLGDTRRPTNEVSLANWSAIVAALFKTALAGAVLTKTQPRISGWTSWRDKIIDHDFLWRILRVNFDVLGLYAKAIKIADLLGYQRVVEKACEAIKKLIEEEYPLGNEIYRDSIGIYFTFPDLDLPAELAQKIRCRVEEVEIELAPRIAVTVGHGSTAAEQLKGILGKARMEALEALAQPFDSQNLSACWQQQWKTVGEGKWEVCPVCHLRPMREGAEACEICLERRVSRVEKWLEDPRTTIWIDEIADHNGRVALIVGKFGLNDWLSGDLVQTMLVKVEPNNPSGCVPKNPSPARLRRVWETCQRFWMETVEKEILAKHDYSKGDVKRCVRMVITPKQKTGWRKNVPYDGTVDGIPISFLWQKKVQSFVTISNLQLSGEIKPGKVVRLQDPGNPRRQFTVTIEEAMPAQGPMGNYTPYLPLLASPDQFLTLVPAAEALEIANQIREKYQEQFGKVQNRLPLFLGLLFFQRKTPLMAVMDTARRMLASELGDSEWRVAAPPQNDGQTVTLNLEQDGQLITLRVPIVMGDGTTEDVWYPYFFVAQFAVRTPDHRRYRFQHDGRWLVHVDDLKENDAVRFTPSSFSYLFLESTSQRFRFDPHKDVLLLDELPRLMNMWDNLKQSGITDTGLRNVQALLESKRAAWKEPGDELKDLAETTLKQADLFNAVTVDDVLSGRFAHCLELHLHILKLKIKEA